MKLDHKQWFSFHLAPLGHSLLDSNHHVEGKLKPPCMTVSAIEIYIYDQVFTFSFEVQYIVAIWFSSGLSKHGFFGILE